MLEGPEVEAHLHHKTGHSLADKILAVLAVFLSCVSVFIAVSHGRTMERLVAANSWPNLSYETGNQDDSGTRHDITLGLRNTGVGPARIDTFEVFYKAQPVHDAAALLKLCCNEQHPNLSTSTVIGEVLPARDTINFVTLPQTPADAPVWDAFNKERFAVRVRACYCSVFDECYVRDTDQPRPHRVDQCLPSQPIQYP
jgi:hypothetical protein